METTKPRRKFYIITAVILIVIFASAALLIEDIGYTYVNIEVVGNSKVSFVVSYDSSTTSLTPSENATVEVLPHANITITATVASPYAIQKWDISGAAYSQKAQDSVNFVTGPGGSAVKVAVELVPAQSG